MTVRNYQNPVRERQHWLTRFRVGMVLLVLVIVVSYQLAPVINPQQRDSGVFAYIGQVITEGGLPYRDAWDNKLPGIYFVDALAFVLFGTNRWAIWLIEAITVFFTALTMFWLLSQLFKRRSLVWVGTAMLVLSTRNPALVSDTNFTEVYALLPQTLCFVAGYRFFQTPDRKWAFSIGLMSGLAFLFKQTTVGNALVFIPALYIARYQLVRSSQPRFRRLLAITIMGGLTPLLLVAGYLMLNGIFLEAIDASFFSARAFHNWVTNEPITILDTIWQTMTASTVPLWLGPLLPFWAIGAWLVIRRVRRARRDGDTPSPAQEAMLTFTVWIALSFLADLVLANYTYRAHVHYYVPLLPSVTILVVMGLESILDRYPHPGRGTRFALAGMWIYFTMAIILGPLGGTVYRLWLADWDFNGDVNGTTDPLAEWVLENTSPEDKVLVWGAMPSINFQSQRVSPVPYHYAYPLIVPDYTTDEQILNMVYDLETNVPLTIIDRTLMDGFRVPPLDEVRREQWWVDGGRRDVADLSPLYEFVLDFCLPVDEVDRAVIYHCGL